MLHFTNNIWEDVTDSVDTINQIVYGTTTSLSPFILAFADSSCCLDIRGNVDNDSSDETDIADLVAFVSYSFGGGAAPECIEEADVDASGSTDIGDIVYLVNFMFGGGPTPLPCL